jgi:hypothetical protein
MKLLARKYKCDRADITVPLSKNMSDRREEAGKP